MPYLTGRSACLAREHRQAHAGRPTCRHTRGRGRGSAHFEQRAYRREGSIGAGAVQRRAVGCRGVAAPHLRVPEHQIQAIALHITPDTTKANDNQRRDL